MRYSNWYNKPIKTSLLGMGCMRFKTDENGKVLEDEAIGLIRKAYQEGVNYFDTAYVYLDGQSEPIVGKALSIYDRDTYYIATKYSFWDLKDEIDMDLKIEEQLANLKTDYIDFYLLHSMNKERFEHAKKYHILEKVIKWKEEGKIKHIGFSFHDDYDTFMEILNYYNWEFCQIQFNYMDYDLQQTYKGYLELLERKIPIIVMEPLKGGSLCNFNKDIQKIMKDYNDDSLTKWAFRWVWSKEGIMTSLSGMNSIEQLEANLSFANSFVKLNEDEENIIKEVSDKLNNVQVVGCTGCKYCMPCVNGVNIPYSFKLLNTLEMYQNIDNIRFRLKMLEEEGNGPSKCIKCNACVKKCPQGIDIPKYLEMVKRIKDDSK